MNYGRRDKNLASVAFVYMHAMCVYVCMDVSSIMSGCPILGHMAWYYSRVRQCQHSSWLDVKKCGWLEHGLNALGFVVQSYVLRNQHYLGEIQSCWFTSKPIMLDLWNGSLCMYVCMYIYICMDVVYMYNTWCMYIVYVYKYAYTWCMYIVYVYKYAYTWCMYNMSNVYT